MLASGFPLTLTCRRKYLATNTKIGEGDTLRSRKEVNFAMNTQVEFHPTTAAAHRIRVMDYLKRYLPSMPVALALLVAAALVLSRNGDSLLYSPDTAMHIAVGRHMVEHWAFPGIGTFGWGEAHPWMSNAWPVQALMGAGFMLIGMGGIVWIFALAYGAFAGVLLASCYEDAKRNPPLALIVFMAGITATYLLWNARTHVFSFFLFMACLRLLRGDQVRSLWWKYPLIMALWVNLHGSWPLGLIALVTTAAGTAAEMRFGEEPGDPQAFQSLKSFASAFALSLPALLVNPYGAKMLTYPFRIVTDTRFIHTTYEFVSPNFHRIEYFPLLVYLLLLLGVAVTSKRRVDFGRAAVAMVTAGMALGGVRYIPYFVIASLPVAIGMLPRIQEEQGKATGHIAVVSCGGTRIIDSAWAAFSGIALLAVSVSGLVPYGFSPEGTEPSGAIEFVRRERPAGKLFCDHAFGPFVLLRIPGQKIFVDPRQDVYEPDPYKDLRMIASALPDLKYIERKYNPDWMILPAGLPVSSNIEKYSSEWVLVYSDRHATVYVRRNVLNERIIEKYGGTQHISMHLHG